MNQEPKHEDASLTLEEALELLGSCDDLLLLDDVHDEPMDSSTSTPKPKKRVRNPLNDVRRRQRRKAERAQLKQQAQEYEAILTRLQRASGDRQAIASEGLAETPATSTWLRAAVEEGRKRREAEDVNGKLKALLIERLQMTGKIRDVLKQKGAQLTLMQKIDPLMELSLSLDPSPLESRFMEYAMTSAGLQGAVHQAFDATDSVLGSFSMDAFIYAESISRVKHDRSGGTCVELLTTTPLDCTVEAARTLLWETLMSQQWPEAQTQFHLKTKDCSPQTVELRFSMSFDTATGSQMMLDGATFLEKHDEKHRTVLAWTSLIVHPSGHLRFRSHGWIVIMKSASDPETASLVRICCRITAEPTKTSLSAHHNSDGKYCLQTRNGILKSMGTRVKFRLEDVQQQLLGQAGPQELITV